MFPSWPQGNLTGPNWHIVGVRTGPKLHMHNYRPWDQQNVTKNRFLQYLVREEIEEQDIVWTDRETTVGQRDGRPDNGRKDIP